MSNLIFFLPPAGLDIGPISDDPSSLPQPNVTQSSRSLSEEQLDEILSPELDKMVTDGNFFWSLILVFYRTYVEIIFSFFLSPKWLISVL